VTPDPYRPWRETLLSPTRVRELSVLRPARVAADAFRCWLVILAAWAAVAAWPLPWVVLVAVPVIGTRYYALFVIGHDGLHRRLFPRRRLNDLFADLFVFGPLGGITRLNNANHLAHHRHLASELDPDRYKHACFNKTTRGELLAFLTGLTSLLRAARSVFLRGRPPAPGGLEDRDGYGPRDLAILVTWQLALVFGLTAAVGWWGYPVLWLLPVYLFTYLADLVRSFVEHSHPEADDRADRHRLVTLLSNPVERLFLAPMNMNFHAAHHLWTSIPYYNLPAADREIRARAEADGLLWRGSYLGYLWRYSTALPLPECRRAAESPAR
jgi:fatty acid desaturase